MVQLAVSRMTQPPWTVLAVTGELDVAGAPDLRGAVTAAVAAGDVRLVLDLGGVDFIDSFGLGVIIGALKRVRQRGGELALVVPDSRIGRVFELCDLDRILPLHESVAEVLDRTAST